MARPSVIVLATPHVFASMVGDAVRARFDCDVLVPDMRVESWPHDRRYDGAITSMPVSGEIADVVIELPESADQPLRVRAQDVAVELPTRADGAVEDALDALERFVLGDEQGIDLVRDARGEITSEP